MIDEEMKNSKDKKGAAPSTADKMDKIQGRSTNAIKCGNNYNYHYAPLFGAICGVLNISQSLTRRMFLRCMVRDIFSSAARLNIMGPLEGASKQRECSTIIETLLNTPPRYGHSAGILDLKKRNSEPDPRRESSQTEISETSEQNTSKKRKNFSNERLSFLEPATTSPILEILQARHDVLYARLFNS
jgi:urease accessory protein UreF